MGQVTIRRIQTPYSKRNSKVYVDEGIIDELDYGVISPPINVQYLQDRAELAEQVISKQIAYVQTLAEESIQQAREIPTFKITVKLNMDGGMRKMYNSIVKQEDLEAATKLNIENIEEALRLRNEMLKLANENYFDHKIAELSPENLADARNLLIEHP